MHPTQKLPVIVLAVDEVALYAGNDILSTITPADVLRHAAVYIAKHGWHRDSLYREEKKARACRLLTTPPACAYGAISMAVFGRPIPRAQGNGLSVPEHWRLYNRACLALDDYLTLTFADLDDDGNPLSVSGDCWNDDPDRTSAQVICALVDAATYYNRTHTPAGGAR